MTCHSLTCGGTPFWPGRGYPIPGWGIPHSDLARGVPIPGWDWGTPIWDWGTPLGRDLGPVTGVSPAKAMGPVEVLWDGDGVPSRKDMGPVEVLWDGDIIEWDMYAGGNDDYENYLCVVSDISVDPFMEKYSCFFLPKRWWVISGVILLSNVSCRWDRDLVAARRMQKKTTRSRFFKSQVSWNLIIKSCDHCIDQSERLKPPNLVRKWEISPKKYFHLNSSAVYNSSAKIYPAFIIC